MTLALTILATYLFLVFGWVLYIAIMGLARVRDQLHPFAKLNAYGIILPVGYAWDAVMNLLVCLAFWRLPRDWVLTGTLQRIRNTEPSGSWRELAAAWICERLLNQFDAKGKHC
jgi:hypothetical protein